MFALVIALSATPQAVEAQTSPGQRTFHLSAKAGVSLFQTAASKVPEHLLKPALRVEFTHTLAPSLELGGELALTVTGDSNYTFNSINLVFKAPLYRGDVFLLQAGWGFGVGQAPPILSSELTTSAILAPTLQVSLGCRWTLLPDHLYLGIEVINEQVVVTSVVLSVGTTL